METSLGSDYSLPGFSLMLTERGFFALTWGNGFGGTNDAQHEKLFEPKIAKSSSKKTQKAATFTRMKRARVTTGPFSFKGATLLELPA